MLEHHIRYLEEMMRDLSSFEKTGLDLSSLRLFIKNLKTFQRLQDLDNNKYNQSFNFDEKLGIIQSFLSDKKAFPRIQDVIEFANGQLSLGFIDQKASRETTIRRVVGRIQETPELKEKVKEAVIKIRNQRVHSPTKKTKKYLESVESFSKWAEILRNL